MATKAFQKIYTKITQITKATCSLKATGVGYDELASVDGKLAQVVKIVGDEVTLQVFSGTEGIRTNAEVVFMGKAPSLKVGDQLAGRFFNAYGEPIDGGPIPEGREVEIGGPSVNPVRRKQPSELIDFVILQQDAFDAIDAVTPLARQEFMLDRVVNICRAEFQFDTFLDVMDYFKKMINICKQMNYSEYQSEAFKQHNAELDELLKERIVK